jgi:molybdate transport system substrate-binding protein
LLSADELSVHAAASLTDAIQEIARNFENKTKAQVVLNLGASNIIARQIQEGAPADIFFSADEAKMDDLQKSRLIDAATRKSLLSNRLVIVIPLESNLRFHSAMDLETVTGNIVLADPEVVPAGIYSKQYLLKIGLWVKIVNRIVPAENVRAALAAIESGNGEAGIVYKTDARISKKVKIAFEVLAAEGPKISYPVAIVSGTSKRQLAEKFLEYLESNEATEIFRKYGFIVLERS